MPSSYSPCHCTNLRGAAHRITSLYDDALAPTGMKITQYRLLRNIEMLKNPTINALATHLDLDRSTIGRNVRVVEREGLVELSSGADLRTTTITLTKTGQRKAREGRKLWEIRQRQIENALGPDLHGRLVDIQEKLKVLETTESAP